MASTLAAAASHAFELDTGDSGIKVRWDNTVKYSATARVADRLPELSTLPPAAPNQNDGNNNFNKGLVSNRIDLLSELDVTKDKFGGRISAAAWYDVRL
jgi:hypothetical protein